MSSLSPSLRDFKLNVCEWNLYLMAGHGCLQLHYFLSLLLLRTVAHIFSVNSHIVIYSFLPLWYSGGQGHQLSAYVLTPKHPSKVMDTASSSYNEAHRQALSCSLKTIGSIKSRFRCLEDLGQVDSGTFDHVARVIYACCVLHNIAKKFSVPLPRELVPEPLHPVPHAAEVTDSATALSEAEIIRDDMIQTCFYSPSEEPPHTAEVGLQGQHWEEEGSPGRGEHDLQTLHTQEQDN